MGLSKLEGRITVASTVSWSIDVTDPGGTTTYAVAVGDYYLTSSTSLLSLIATQLNASIVLTGVYALTLDDDSTTSTGKVTIACNQTFSITWNSTVIRNALGFTGNLSGSTSYTSTNSSPYVWLPDQRRANPLSPDGTLGVPVTDASVTMTPAGLTKVLKYSTRYRDNLEYRYLSGRKVWTEFEVVDNESLQSFWTATIALGALVRHHPERATDGTFVTWRVCKPQELFVQAEFAGFVGQVGQDGSATRWKYGPVDVVAS